MTTLPLLFLERLREIIPAHLFDVCAESFCREKPLSVRINTLRTSREEVLRILNERHIRYEEIPWCVEALILNNISQREFAKEGLIEQGRLYVQSLSSMLPARILLPKPGEDILDMCAAPGSKTTQMAALMDNQGKITAIEAIKDRFYKLKSVVSLLGAANVELKLMDARKFRSPNRLFDKILVDSPCSSEGRFRIQDRKTYQYWSPRKIKEMAHKQKGLLLSASRLLKNTGTLVYSTCTFAPEENEKVIDWLLKKTKGAMEVMPVHCDGVDSYPAMTQWQNKRFSDEVRSCLRILPRETMEGFFIAKLIKKRPL